MAFLIGIDNTDNKASRGTGFRARQLASELELAGFGKVLGIVRHQLLVSEDIPMTSQNGSNSIEVDCCDPEGLKSFCHNFLIRESVPGSSPGICVAHDSTIFDEIEDWGRRAKRELLETAEAASLADIHNIHLEGVKEDFHGIIGALAAVGLRKTGNDGRFIWQAGKQLKDLWGGMSVEAIKQGTMIDDIITKDGKILGPDQIVDLTDWVRAVLINNKSYLIAEKNMKRSGNEWKIVDKEYIRKIGS